MPNYQDVVVRKAVFLYVTSTLSNLGGELRGN